VYTLESHQTLLLDLNQGEVFLGTTAKGTLIVIPSNQFTESTVDSPLRGGVYQGRRLRPSIEKVSSVQGGDFVAFEAFYATIRRRNRVWSSFKSPLTLSSSGSVVSSLLTFVMTVP